MNSTTDIIPYYDCHCHHPAAAGVVAVRSYDVAELPPVLSGLTAAGLHPWYAAPGGDHAADLQKLETLAAAGQLAAIGECGLDRLRGAPLAEQQLLLARQLTIAARAKLPVILHSVRAWPELLAIRRRFPASPWLIHGFTGKPETATALLAADCLLSGGAALLRSERLCQLFATLPADRILLETDAATDDINKIYATLAAARRVNPDVLKRQLQSNFTGFFRKVLIP